MFARKKFGGRRKGLFSHVWSWIRLRVLGEGGQIVRRARASVREVYERRPDLAFRRRWLGRHWLWRQTKRVSLLVVIAGLVFALFISIWSFFADKPWPGFFNWLTGHRTRSGLGGDVLSNVFFTLAPVAIAFGVFLAFRYRRATNRYLRMARKSPAELVQTAGSIVGTVVGRDGLCLALQTELRDSETRRPHVLVGGLGVGKTAMLVRLTELLARRGAVPVAVRLRDADEDIDFPRMARRRFQAIMQPYLRTEAEGDRIWRQLVKDDRVVVLADGLEEAFAEEDAGRVRNHRVRVAVKAAADQKCPVIIASRPHDALRALDAAITHLEPLGEDAALGYVRGDEPTLPDAIAERLLDAVQITESPIYLTIARELNAEDLLKSAVISRRQDRVTLRLALFEEWCNALVSGKLEATRDVALSEPERRAVLAHLYAHAYLGLREDTQQVTFDMWERGPATPSFKDADEDREREKRDADKRFRAALQRDVGRRLNEIQPTRGCEERAESAVPIFELAAAVSKGMQLGLVEPLTNGGRYPHSVVQAYLGAHVLDVAMGSDGDPYLDTALHNPGRELLLACVMFSRMRPDGDTRLQEWRNNVEGLAAKLGAARTERNDETDAKRLDILAAAAEIETEIARWRKQDYEQVGAQPRAEEVHGRPGREDVTIGRELNLDDEPAYSESGSASARAAGDVRQRPLEEDPRAPLPARTSTGGGGHGPARSAGAETTPAAAPDRRPDPALSAIEALDWTALQARDDTMLESKLNFIERLGAAARVMPTQWQARAYHYLYRNVCLVEGDYRLRLAAAQEIGSGGDAAWSALGEALTVVGRQKTDEWKDWAEKLDKNATVERKYLIQAWLLPLLLESVGDPTARSDVDAMVKEWIRSVARGASRGEMPLSVEAALAQGFKYAANRRPHHSHENAEARQLLQKHAREMISRARFWYARLSLLQALCLWQIAHNVYPGNGGNDGSDGARDPDTVIAGWLRRADAKEESHRFVREAAELARAALRTNRPEEYLWIDESGVVTKVGSSAEHDEYQAVKSLWIPPSAGWLMLDRTAQQLVADVLIVLNLAERGDEAGVREERLHKVNSGELPKCVTGERARCLQPSLTAGAAEFPNPSSTCRQRCQVGLCPYPARGHQPYRVELSEAFCRGQQVALLRHRPAPWQDGSGVELRRFWREMERRARI